MIKSIVRHTSYLSADSISTNSVFALDSVKTTEMSLNGCLIVGQGHRGKQQGVDERIASIKYMTIV